MKTTRWLPVKVPPVRIGYYEVKYSGHPPMLNGMRMMFFDGRTWRFGPNEDKSIFGNIAALGDKWRGLTKEAK